MKIKRPKLVVGSVFAILFALFFITLIVANILFMTVPAFGTLTEQLVISLADTMPTVTLFLISFVVSGIPMIMACTALTIMSLTVARDLYSKAKLSDIKYNQTTGLLLDLLGSFIVCNLVSVVVIIMQMIDDDKQKNQIVSTSIQNQLLLEQELENLKNSLNRGTISQDEYAQQLSKIIENYSK